MHAMLLYIQENAICYSSAMIAKLNMFACMNYQYGQIWS